MALKIRFVKDKDENDIYNIWIGNGVVGSYDDSRGTVVLEGYYTDKWVDALKDAIAEEAGRQFKLGTPATIDWTVEP